MPENLHRAPTEWACPPLHSLLAWEISRCVQHCSAKCFHIPVFQLWMGSWALKDHFTVRIAWVVGRELKRLGLMASRKLQATWDLPLVLLPRSFDWQLRCCNCVTPPSASGDCFGSGCMETATERRTICDKTDSLCRTSWDFPGQMYHSPPKISSRVANCYHCERSQ